MQLVPGTKAGPGGPAGFATLKTLLTTPELKAGGINVFGRPSGKMSVFLKVKVRRHVPSHASQHCTLYPNPTLSNNPDPDSNPNPDPNCNNSSA